MDPEGFETRGPEEDYRKKFFRRGNGTSAS